MHARGPSSPPGEVQLEALDKHAELTPEDAKEATRLVAAKRKHQEPSNLRSPSTTVKTVQTFSSPSNRPHPIA